MSFFNSDPYYLYEQQSLMSAGPYYLSVQQSLMSAGPYHLSLQQGLSHSCLQSALLYVCTTVTHFRRVVQ
jgi:hypothetical protein